MIPKKLLRFPVYREDWKELIKLPCDLLRRFSLIKLYQRYTEADTAVQKEAYALLDLVHMIETTPRWRCFNIRAAALTYSLGVLNQEWEILKSMTSSVINTREHNRSSSLKIVAEVQGIQPEGDRELTIFSQTLSLLDAWLDARRSRILSAQGNSAQALWPLLLTGAFVLFAFHGLFVAVTPGIWIALLAGISLVIGLTFYLIFTLDSPFAGSPCIDSEPFRLAINLLERHAEAETIISA